MNHSRLNAAGAPNAATAPGADMVSVPRIGGALGKAMNDKRHSQIVKSASERNMIARKGLTGSAAIMGNEQYLKSFKAPEKTTNTFLIRVGH